MDRKSTCSMASSPNWLSAAMANTVSATPGSEMDEADASIPSGPAACLPHTGGNLHRKGAGCDAGDDDILVEFVLRDEVVLAHQRLLQHGNQGRTAAETDAANAQHGLHQLAQRGFLRCAVRHQRRPPSAPSGKERTLSAVRFITPFWFVYLHE